MAVSDHDIKVLLRVLSDTGGLKDLNNELDKTKEKTKEVADAGKDAGDKAAAFQDRLTIAFGVGALVAAPFVAMLNASGQLIAENSEAILAQTRALDKQVDSWIRLAERAHEFGDAIKLADRVSTDLASVAAQYEKFRATQLTGWQTWADTVAKLLNPLEAAAGAPGPNEAAKAAATAKARDVLVQGVTAGNVVIDTANAAVARVAEIKALPVAEGIYKVTQRVTELQGKLADLDVQRKGGTGTDEQLAASLKAIDNYGKIGDQLKDEQGLLKELTAEQNKQTPAVEKTHAAHEKVVDALKDEKDALEEINGAMATVEGNPLLTLDQQNEALAKLIPEAMRLQTAISGSGAAVDQLAVKMQMTTFGGQMRASLVQFVNQIGTTAQQVGNLITSTIGTAVNGVSNAIMGAIFRTQTWGQAFAEVAKQIIGNLINVALQWVVQRGVMALINLAFGEVEATASKTLAAESAAAWAPAAVAASTASYGVAATAGLSAFTTAEIAGVAVARGLVTGFDMGGFTGAGSGVAGVVHRGEYVMPRSTVDRAGGAGGMDNVRSAIEGGGGRDTSPHIYIFTDASALQKHWRANPASKKQVIDWVNSSGGNLRT